MSRQQTADNREAGFGVRASGFVGKGRGQAPPLRAIYRLIALCCLLSAVCSLIYAAPPSLDVAPAIGDGFFNRHWQTVFVTVANPDSGEAIQGEAQIIIQDAGQGQRWGAFSHPVALPKGAETARVPVTIYLPEDGGPKEMALYVVNAPDKGRAVVAERKISRLPIAPGGLTLVAVASQPDALAYLRGKSLGVIREGNDNGGQARGGTLRPSSEKKDPFGLVQVARVADPAELPDRAAGYDAAGIVFLGAETTPAAFSDAQASALRAYVAGGGFLLVSGAKLRDDERFRRWIPPPPAPAGDDFALRHHGMGNVAVLAFDPTEPGFANAPNALPFWQRLARQGVAPGSVGRIAAGDAGYRYESFPGSVLHIPGFTAPGVGYIALFLGAYLILLIPINYLVLRRLDRREWAWISIPALAALFSLGAYGFSYAVKGRQVRVNVAAIVEMGEGNGDALTHAMIGVFSPSRARYAVSVDALDAVLWSPSLTYSGMGEKNVILSAEQENRGTIARDVAVPMWGMSVVAAQTNAVRFGDGIVVRAQQEGDRITGELVNRTGRRLENAIVRFGVNGQALGTLTPDQRFRFSFRTGAKDRLPPEAGLEKQADYSSAVTDTIETRRQIAGDVSQSAQEAIERNEAARALPPVSQSSNFSSRKNAAPPENIVVSGWSYEPTLPIQVDNHVITEGENVTLIFAYAPKP